jgi:hypothetical protein
VPRIGAAALGPFGNGAARVCVRRIYYLLTEGPTVVGQFLMLRRRNWPPLRLRRRAIASRARMRVARMLVMPEVPEWGFKLTKLGPSCGIMVGRC